MSDRTFGDVFHHCRLIRGITQKSLAQATALRPEVVAALERDAYDRLPDWGILEPALNRMAEKLGADSHHFLAHFITSAQKHGYDFTTSYSPQAAMHLAAARQKSSRRQGPSLLGSLPWKQAGLTLLLVGCIGGVLAGSAYITQQQDQTVSEWSSLSAPHMQTVEGDILEVHATGRVQIRVRLDSGKIRSVLLQPGNREEFRGSYLTLMASHPDRLEVRVNGKAVEVPVGGNEWNVRDGMIVATR